MKINVITLFPDIIKHQLQYLPFKRAVEKHSIEVNIVNLRNYALDNYGTVDGKPYGGGTGMLLRVEPIYEALKDLKMLSKKRGALNKVILTSPSGSLFTQKKAEEFSTLKEITLICGRYEGVDARVKHFVDEDISIGNFVLSGGELAVLVMLESTVRLMPGVIEKEDATQLESFSEKLAEQSTAEEGSTMLEYPQFTRPEDFMGLKVPHELISGNHKEIEKWKKNNTKVSSNTH